MGIEGESERIASDACSAVDIGRSGKCGQSSQALEISARQMKRLRRKMKRGGIEALVHGNRAAKTPKDKN
jgi:hypothetical protein